MKKYTYIKKEDRESTARAFGIGGKSMLNIVWFDNWRGDTDLAKRVRKLAMGHGGIVMVEVPETETPFDADGYMRQYLPNNTMLKLNRKTDGCEMFHEGERVCRYEDVEMTETKSIQSWALALR